MNKDEQKIAEKLLSETALMHWRELQRFFAQGKVIYVHADLDLVQTAVYFAMDEVDKLTTIIDSQKIMAPSNEQARKWFDSNTELWTVVVAPYVLIQEQEN